MKKPYEFVVIKPQLYLIKWIRTPHYREELTFVAELGDLLKNSEIPLYFISDVRNGRLISSQAISQLVALTKHDNWAGSTAFSDNSISNIFVSQFQKSLGSIKDKNSMFNYAEEAVAFIQALAPDLTDDIEWNTYFPKINLA